ncbi:helix-turn-helix transcriptional regulator [Cupriavidus sp. 30B13]|uniref:helix-turn-helix transcriptional regulator n=1 Tax=Cupriavidus sp. 30B13 TaxID=3384241 RepID=UPI003B9177B5
MMQSAARPDRPPPTAAFPVIDRLDTTHASITRMRCDEPGGLPPAPVIASQDAFSAIVQLRPFAAHTLWRDGRQVFAGGHAEGALAITSLQQSWRCHHRASFDNVRLQVGCDELQAFAREHGARAPISLRNPEGDTDAVMLSLARAFLPSLEMPAQASRLFLDQLANAMLAHLVAHYGSASVHMLKTATLSRRQEALAKEYLVAHAGEDVSIEMVAAHCNLSRSYFIKAFKQNTGVTPYRWLLEHRIEQSKGLLRQGIPISEIAARSGFSDQSHFTRIFSGVVGIPPAKWRNRNDL